LIKHYNAPETLTVGFYFEKQPKAQRQLDGAETSPRLKRDEIRPIQLDFVTYEKATGVLSIKSGWDEADDARNNDLYDRFIKAAIAEAIDPHAAWYCWHASRRQRMVDDAWEKNGAFVHQQIIWAKPNRPILTRSWYLWAHEPCFMGWIKGNKPPRESSDYERSVWEIEGLNADERPDHPTPKPLECFAVPMRQHTKKDGLCYEPFSGSGSQLIAGEQLGHLVPRLPGPGH
jgi:DNA modification methylase